MFIIARLIVLCIAVSLVACQTTARRNTLPQTAATTTATHEAHRDGIRFLVTFEQQHFSPPVRRGGSSHIYHSGDNWRLPLHLSSAIRQLEKKFLIREVDGWPIKSINRYCAVFEVDGNRDLTRLLDTIRSDKNVASAQTINQFVGLGHHSYNDPKFNLQYGSYAAAVQILHQHTRGQRVKVGIIDSPVDGTHPDLHGQITHQYDYVDAPSTQDKLHGTAVAGVIAAAANNGVGLVGLAPEASIYVYGACARRGTKTVCTSFALAKALEQAIEDGVDVLNLSLAGPEDELLRMLIQAAHKREMAIMAAHNPHSTDLNFPASMAEVFAIGVKQEKPQAGNNNAHWFASNEQLSTQAGGGYQFFYGSSVAAAGATGLIALLRSHWPAAQSQQLMQSLMTSPCESDITVADNRGFLFSLKQAANCTGDKQILSGISPAKP